MKAEDVKLGMRVVPHSKSTGLARGLERSQEWLTANARNQPFLWVVAIREDHIGLCVINRSDSYDRFLAEDFDPFEPYVEITRQKMENDLKSILPNGKLLGEHLYGLTQDNDELENMLYRLNQVGSDAFISELPEHSLGVLVANTKLDALSKSLDLDYIPKVKDEVKTAIKKEDTPEPKPLHQWEYLTLAFPEDDLIGFYGKLGWELVTIYNGTFYFKRPCNG